MAKVTSPLQSVEARGRVGGLVYNTWRGIRTVKTHTPPHHQDDPKRLAHKLIVQAAGQRWRTITAAQREMWNYYATIHFDLDWTGNAKRIAGFHWYVRIQTRLQDMGLDYIDTPPTEDFNATCLLMIVGLDETFITPTWDYDATPDMGEYHVDLWLTKGLSIGRSPTLHDATRQALVNMGDLIVDIPYFGTGNYTLFFRAIRHNGLTGTWNSVSVYAE